MLVATYEPEVSATSFSVIINEDRWNGLPDDIRQIFEDASGREWHARVGDIWASEYNRDPFSGAAPKTQT